MAVLDQLLHHGSHLGLLRPTPGPGREAPVDAVIVPAARPVGQLANAIALTRRLGCQLLILCSHRVRAAQAGRPVRQARVAALAVDINGPGQLPSVGSARQLAGTGLETGTDTSLKRNIGLSVARMAGWSRILFLDDDIEVARHQDVLAAAAQLDTFDAVGLRNEGFPDHSVVCFCYRATGGQQESFVGGGALAVPADRTSAFFPAIYNDDWFFLLTETGLGSVTVTGSMKQKDYDPYASRDRARTQEFGDCLAEGVYALLDDDRRISDADERFWTGFTDRRRRFIASVLDVVDERRPAQWRAMRRALLTALDCHRFISAGGCHGFLRAWQADRATWSRYLDGLPAMKDPAEAMEHLGFQVQVNTLDE